MGGVREYSKVATSLGLKPGDIILSEIPFEDAARCDFETFQNFVPGHGSIWVGDHLEKPFAHSCKEVYAPPGLQLTDLWDGRHVVFRYSNKEVASKVAKIMESWSSGVKNELFTQQTYEISLGKDLLFLLQAQEFELGQDGILMALCFAALRECSGEPHYHTGQRCTSMLTAAFQASMLASIVKSDKEKNHFNRIKFHNLQTFLEEISELGWRETTVGKKLIAAIEKNNFNDLFPAPFAVDLHYANPRMLYEKLKMAEEFFEVGYFSYFDKEVVAIQKNELDSAA